MARRFDGSADLGIQANAPQVGQPFTMSWWLKPVALPASGNVAVVTTWAGAGATEPTSEYDKTLFYRSTGIVGFYVYDGATKRVVTTSGLSTSAYHHILVTADGTNIKIFFDGVEEGTMAGGATYTSYSNPDIKYSFLTNSVVDSETTRVRMNCDIAEVALWTVVLNADEITALTKGMNPRRLRPASLSRYVPFNTDSDTEQHDWSGNAATVALTSAPTASDHPPVEPFPNQAYRSSLEEASAGGALSGTASSTTSASGTLAGAGALSGSASATSSASGTLAGQGALAGTSSATSTASGTLSGNGSLSGTSSASTVASGVLSGAGALSGSGSSTTTATGTLAGSGALSGTASAVASASGLLTNDVAGAMTGSASATSSASGTLSGSGALSGSASATTSGSGTLSGAGSLSGSASATSDALATIQGQGALSGSSSASSSASGTVSGSGSLSGTSSALCVAVGLLAATGALSGSASAVASASGTITDPNNATHLVQDATFHSKGVFTVTMGSKSSVSIRESSK